MTLKELKEKIDGIYNNSEQYHDWEIVIPNNKISMGAKSATRVNGIGVGFDWNKGKIFISPEHKLIESEK